MVRIVRHFVTHTFLISYAEGHGRYARLSERLKEDVLRGLCVAFERKRVK
jgi:hypothetical protein